MWQKNVRYLDYNACSGISGSVRHKIIEVLERSESWFVNPSSQHRPGQQSWQLLQKSAIKIAASLGKKVDPKELVFTSSGTEASQTVIRSAMSSYELIVIGAAEHSATHDLISMMPDSVRCAELPLLSNGQYDLKILKEILANEKRNGCSNVLLSLFWANNETGAITSLTDLQALIRDSGLNVDLHLDGAQVWGKLPLELSETPADFITFSSHKIGAPAGTGIIWIRPGKQLSPFLIGTQNGGLRGGTENLLGIASTAFAAEELNPQAMIELTSMLRLRLEQGLKSIAEETGIPIRIWSEETQRISNTSRISFCGFDQDQNWVQLLDLRGFAVSHGSACKSKIIEPSRVLLAMGATRGEALNTIRISFGPDSEIGHVEEFLVAIRALLREKRGLS